MKNKWSIIIIIAAAVLYLSKSTLTHADENFHSNAEAQQYHTMGIEGLEHPIFQTSKVCGGCHGYDPAGVASRDAEGNDINLLDDWKATMMGLAAIDPLWRAKVAHEVSLLPEHKGEIEGTCLTCHAPMGHLMAGYNNQQYLFDDLYKDSLGIDGVSCMLCHSISKDNLGKTFSGGIELDTFRVAYGPYPFPFDGPMTSFVGVKPIYSFHIFDAGICADCHTLITPTIDMEGNPTNGTFIEQATYHEWLNSIYNESLQFNKTCQSCHMDDVFDPVVIASGIDRLEPRQSFKKHNFSGANVQMLTVIRDNSAYLGLDIADSLFDESIARAKLNLQEKSVDLLLVDKEATNDSLMISIQLSNKAGHKFPSGYPTRRAYLEFMLYDSNGDTLFHSGEKLDDRLTQLDEDYEPHYDIISDEDQVQIYQMVHVNTDMEVTNRLNQAFVSIKDNRLVPVGFSTLHSVYDTVAMLGEVINDPNFNYSTDGEEGSGTDIITYKISRDDYNLLEGVEYSAKMNIWYETIPVKDLDEMFASGLPQTDTLQTIFRSIPTLVNSIEIDSLFLFVGNTEIDRDLVRITLYPNPTSNYIKVSISNVHSGIEFIEIINTSGQVIKRTQWDRSRNMNIALSDIPSGVYFISVKSGNQTLGVKRFVKS